ncbi:DNL zinc finger domain-containing protein [Purpureocillium lavendulum]|uniref:DNL zinc finger domain-containing protein n=1 Tax=Purpureocillium lavendulum TaxID=1247861 RepID=A0AB34G2Y9_9HYPO|nr:DNL zinc finger domain-containing protein [Purpureocillium lavendulum]
MASTKSLPLLRPAARSIHTSLPRAPPSPLRRSPLRALAAASALPPRSCGPACLSFFSTSSRRAAHSIPRPPPRRISPEAHAAAGPSGPDAPKSEGARPDAPAAGGQNNQAYYQLSFTCVPCGHRSHHNVSKQGYHAGSVLITCPGCRNRHVISDHLAIFGDRSVTVEDLMREKGNLVKRGSLGEDGDIEFWPDDEASAADSGPDASATKPGGSA